MDRKLQGILRILKRWTIIAYVWKKHCFHYSVFSNLKEHRKYA